MKTPCVTREFVSGSSTTSESSPKVGSVSVNRAGMVRGWGGGVGEMSADERVSCSGDVD